MSNLLNQKLFSQSQKPSTRKLEFETLEGRELLAADLLDQISLPAPIQSDQVLVSQENTLDNNVKVTMDSVLKTFGDRTLADYSLTTSNNTFPISKNVSLAEYPSVNSYFQEKNYTNFSTNYEITLNDRKLLFVQADKHGKVNTTKEVYAYDTKTKELLNVYTWSDLMMISKFDNILDCSFDPNSTTPVSCEVVNDHLVVSLALTNSSGRLAKNNIYGVKALKRFELTDQSTGTQLDTFFVNRNLSTPNYSDITQYLQKNNYTNVSDSYEVALNDRKLVFFQANKKVGENNISEVFSYDTKTRELLAIQSWSNSKNLTNINTDTTETSSFNMGHSVPVSCRVIDNHALIQVAITGTKSNTNYATILSKSYNLLDSNTQPNTNEGSTTETTNSPSNPSVVTSDDNTPPIISNISLMESYPKIKEYIQRNNFKSVSDAYEVSLSDRKILFIQASRQIGNNTFSEVFTYDTKTKAISNVNSWAELMKRDQYIDIYNCSLDTSNGAPVTCEIDGNYAVVTVRLNNDSGSHKLQAFKRYELQGTNNPTLKYDKYFVNNTQSISEYPIITRYLQNKSYNNISSSYEVSLNDRKFVFVQAEKQAGGKTSSEIFVYDTKTKVLSNIESWAWTNDTLRNMDSSISSLSFNTAYEAPVKCTIIDNSAVVSVYYEGKSERTNRTYSSMVSRSFNLRESGAQTSTSPTDTLTIPYGPMPKWYYMNN